MKFIKSKLKNSSAMPYTTGQHAAHSHEHGQHHHVHGAGCCHHDHHQDHQAVDPMEDDDGTTPGKGGCC